MKDIDLFVYIFRSCRTKKARITNPIKAVKGALTVEAALLLPVMLCAFFSVIFLIKTVYTYELIQHAITETATEIASSSYIYHISGVRDLHDTVRNSINDRSDEFEEQIGSMIDAYSSLKGINNLNEATKAINDTSQNLSEIFDNTQNIISDPANELKTIACYIAGGTINDIKTQLYIPIVKLYIKKYLVSDNNQDIDNRLRKLGVVNGFDGLDFSESSFLSDRDENIDIVIRYSIRMPLPVQFHEDMQFVQRVKVRTWMGGDEKTSVLEGSSVEEGGDIWSLNNFQRGLKLRRIFGANLPTSFPVIAKYDNGKAVMIKSMDLTANSYQNSLYTEKTLKGYVKELADYLGQDKPWGSQNITIRGEDLHEKELLLIIPENELDGANEAVLRSMKEYARSNGISLTIKKYGGQA